MKRERAGKKREDNDMEDPGMGFGQSEIIDIPGRVESCPVKWHNETLSRVNDSVVRLGIFEGEFHWHKHEKEDEFFFVISGTLMLDLPEGTVRLQQYQAYTVPREVMHRTRAEERTVVIMVEGATVKPGGDP